ncbi:MAG: nickel pincer cofactor biosynthesis protein LarC [Phycisphaerae bacterium]
MTIAYFDCFAGAGGDMIVGALVDAGADFEALKAALSRLGVAGLAVKREKVNRGGIVGTKFTVKDVAGDQAHRHISDVLTIIESASLPARAADRAGRIFKRLAEAEAKVHQVSYDEVHFHEVGAIDSIADVVGACVAMELLKVERVLCSPMPLGSGTVQCEHGLMPVPPPAVAELLKGAKTCAGEIVGEATTPTAAAVFSTLTEGYGPMPAMDLTAVGYGAGSRTGGKLPNLLRVFIGADAEVGTADTVVELSANIDDATGEVLGATIDKLLSAGCVDAWAAPIVMKKSRPAWMLSALCLECDADAAQRIMFAQTTTFGIRRRVCSRAKLARQFDTVQTRYGPVRVKVGRLGDEVMTAAPEFSDCAAAADAHHVSAREVMAEAQAAWRGGRRA